MALLPKKKKKEYYSQSISLLTLGVAALSFTSDFLSTWSHHPVQFWPCSALLFTPFQVRKSERRESQDAFLQKVVVPCPSMPGTCKNRHSGPVVPVNGKVCISGVRCRRQVVTTDLSHVLQYQFY